MTCCFTRVVEMGSSSVPLFLSSSLDWMKMSPDTAASDSVMVEVGVVTGLTLGVIAHACHSPSFFVMRTRVGRSCAFHLAVLAYENG